MRYSINSYISVQILVVLFILPACNQLEENLVGELTTDTGEYPLIADCSCGPNDGLFGVYEELRNTGTANHGSYYSLQEITSDEMTIIAKGADWGNRQPLIDLHQHTYQPTHTFLNNTWVQTYRAIDRINKLLEQNYSYLDADEIAEATALRAYFYLRLLDLFGNVKLVTSPRYEGVQVNRKELFDFVEAELLTALGVTEITAELDLAESPLTTDANPYQINQYGALGILAKLYLNAGVYTNQNRYAEAAAAATYIIDSGFYRLCGAGCQVLNLGKRNGVSADPDNLEGYAAVFAPNNENNPEHIFAVFYDELSGTGMNFSHMNLHKASQLSYSLTEQPWNGYAVLEEFYNAYESEDARKEASFLVGKQLDFGGNAILDYTSNEDEIALNYTPQIGEITNNTNQKVGVRSKKFSYKLFGRTNMDNDYPIVRLGEMYLTRAEATARLSGDWNQAIPDVNILRARAGVSLYTTLDEVEFLAERGRELFQESTRRTDLIRFGKYNDTWWEKPSDLSDHVNIFPIPFEQIEASGGSLVQNPGY